MQIAFVGIFDDLADCLVDGGVDGAPLVGEDRTAALYDIIGEPFQQVVSAAGEPEKGLAGELDTEGLELEGMGLDGHIELPGIEDIVMAADEVEILVQLLVIKAVVAAEAEVETDDVVIVVAGAETGEGIEAGDGMAHSDAIYFPEEGIAGPRPGDELLTVLHSIKIWRT